MVQPVGPQLQDRPHGPKRPLCVAIRTGAEERKLHAHGLVLLSLAARQIVGILAGGQLAVLYVSASINANGYVTIIVQTGTSVVKCLRRLTLVGSSPRRVWMVVVPGSGAVSTAARGSRPSPHCPGSL